MYLEKLEIQGFKSFANKNTLVFPGMLDKERRGITSIVGPNGSGKSNIADAVRWALGEQSMKALRGKKSEDVIFSGSDKKGGLSMAEVSLFLNNENKKAPIDYSQIVLTRRLFRDGESEYLLNNSRTRLSDIQMLLAKASFGQKTYSVIGQGMVEGFLNTSLAERKEFFDEATGVKQFQIKRDESLNKLVRSYENLTQVEMLLDEIEPRLRSLTRQMNKLQKREELETQLKELQIAYYRQIWHELNGKFNEQNGKFLNLEKDKLEKDKKMEALNKKLSQLETQNEITTEFNEWQKELAALQNKKDAVTRQLAKLEAELEIKLEAAGQFDLSWLTGKKGELAKEMETAEEEIKSLKTETEEAKIAVLRKERENISKKIEEINNKLKNKITDASNGEAIKINQHLEKFILKLEMAEAENDLGKIKKIIQEIKTDLKKITGAAKNEGIDEMTGLRTELTAILATREELSARIHEYELNLSAKNERGKLLKEKLEKTKKELAQIGEKIKKYSHKSDSSETGKEREALKKELGEVEKKIFETKEKINNFSRSLDEKRSALFELQRNATMLQNELNRLNIELNEIKINSARYETRLEDLEAEIRNSLGGLKEVKEKRVEGKIDLEAAKEKIDSLKRQLDLIGGIDPETEKEYLETKERFDFLSGQVKDLKSAIESLEKIIKELDMVIKEKFDKEFKVIQQKFEEYFKILFNGGQAKIIKVMAETEENADDKKEERGKATRDGKETGSFDLRSQDDEDADIKEKQNAHLKRIKFLQKYNATGLAGVEIQATPPGKKIKIVAMLSGGERALTAIAMICAIISANPSPFVVLDEVDAALDEANSERLAKILDDLSHKTQFIIITHNRASMRRANILYGITMQDDGVSKLLSVKLDEAGE